MGIDHHNTASIAVGKVFEALPNRALLSIPREELRAAEEAAKREIFFSLAGTYERPRRERLDDMLEVAKYDVEMMSLSGYDPREDDPEAKHPYEALIADLEETIAEARELWGHRCEWGEDDYCVHCQADGRA